MQRQAARAALRRSALALDSTCMAKAAPITPTLHGRQPFSTSSAAQNDNNPFSRGPPPAHERSQEAADRLGRLPLARPSGFVDARSFRDMKATAPADSSKIISIRSIRGRGGLGRGGTARGPMGRGGMGRGPVGRGGVDNGFSRSPPDAGPGGFQRTGSFTSRGGSGGRGGMRGRGRGGRDARGGRGPPNKPQKLKYSQEEQAIFDRNEQGIVREYVPTVQMKDLSGYGAPVATDATLGQVETALRTMRIMGGGNAFNSDAGVTVDARSVRRRYLKERKPVFFNSLEEKDWAERASRQLKVTMPEDATKKGIIDLTIRGVYEAPGYADLSDAIGTVANYHNSTFSYTQAHSQAFVEKIRSLLPVDTTARPAGEQKKLA